MKIVSFIVLLSISLNSFAADRQEMIDYFILKDDVESSADKALEKYRDDVVVSDKRINYANINETYGNIFEDFREDYIDAHVRAYEVYTDEQIQEMYEFYRSDFGKWYLEEERTFGKRVGELLVEPTRAFAIKIAEKRRMKKKSK